MKNFYLYFIISGFLILIVNFQDCSTDFGAIPRAEFPGTEIQSSTGTEILGANSSLQVYPLSVPTHEYRFSVSGQTVKTKIIDTTFPLPEPQGYTIGLTVTPGEFEPATFVLRATANQSGITISSSALLGPQGSQILPGSIDIKLVKTWYQPSCGYDTSISGKFLIPELLVKDDALIRNDFVHQTSSLRARVNGLIKYVDVTTAGSVLPVGAIVDDATSLQPFNLAANTNKQVWITLHPPLGTPAGIYNGFITISVPGKQNTKVSLTVNVLPFTLSTSLISQSIYYRGQLHDSCPTLDGDCKTATQLKADLINMRNHGILYPTVYQSIKDTTALTSHLALMETVGLPRNRLYNMGDLLVYPTDPSNLAKVANIVNNWNDFAKARGWGQVYFYGRDEARGTVFDSQLPIWDTVHQNGGKMFASIPDAATAMRPTIVNIDVPVVYGTTNSTTAAADLASAVAQLNSLSIKVFKYGEPFSGFEQPEYERHYYGFSMLARGFSGAMNYAYQQKGYSWNDFEPTMQNETYTYPGTTAPIDTVQWEGHREGTDDIRYLSTLSAIKKWTKTQTDDYAKNLLANATQDPLKNRH
ncbi:MAG: hypothetical protein A4S09_14225 [Proteobacteria bacterium SG_bin7]|nr:MAG: hypothetical protein A4S09_14225 [Proteobacteria bacterium SG_bin7]